MCPPYVHFVQCEQHQNFENGDFLVVVGFRLDALLRQRAPDHLRRVQAERVANRAVDGRARFEFQVSPFVSNGAAGLRLAAAPAVWLPRCFELVHNTFIVLYVRPSLSTNCLPHNLFGHA
jgi:hypothetical protein